MKPFGYHNIIVGFQVIDFFVRARAKSHKQKYLPLQYTEIQWLFIDL